LLTITQAIDDFEAHGCGHDSEELSRPFKNMVGLFKRWVQTLGRGHRQAV
jgi:hypothetical protein